MALSKDVILTRKAREGLTLEHAARLLARDGFQDLKLDELANAVECSKGTLCLHFKTKNGVRHDTLDRRICREVFPEATWFKSERRKT